VQIGHDVVPAGSEIATATTEEWVVLAADFELPKQLFDTHDSSDRTIKMPCAFKVPTNRGTKLYLFLLL
jgi:hypothetical protein